MLTGILAVILSFAGITICNSYGQSRTHHVTIPSSVVDTLNMGVLSWQVYYYNSNIWLHNPTDDTLIYDARTVSVGGSLFFDYKDNFDYFTIIPPHDSTKLLYFAIGSEFPEYGEWNIGYQVFGDTLDKNYTPLVTTCYAKDRDDLLVEVFEDQFVYTGISHYDSNSNVVTADSQEYLNDQDSLVTIKTMFIPKGSHYTITGYSSDLPVTLEKGEKLTVYYSYGEADTVAYIDSLTQDTSYWDIVIIVTDTTYPVASASFNGQPPKAEIKSSVPNIFRYEDTKIVLYPNPTTKELTISHTSERAERVVMYDMTGALVRSDVVNGEATWDVSALPSGSYMLGIPGGKMQVVQVVK
jgi:hypothetical protein